MRSVMERTYWNRPKIRIAVIVTGVILMTSLCPVRYVSAPEWDVWVVDEVGTPLANMTARLRFQNYCTEAEGHEADGITDVHGHVHFAMRFGSASALRVVTYSLRSARDGVHASFGRHATVFAFGQGRDGIASSGDLITDWIGAPERMTSKIVAHRRKNQL